MWKLLVSLSQADKLYRTVSRVMYAISRILMRAGSSQERFGARMPPPPPSVINFMFRGISRIANSEA